MKIYDMMLDFDPCVKVEELGIMSHGIELVLIITSLLHITMTS